MQQIEADLSEDEIHLESPFSPTCSREEVAEVITRLFSYSEETTLLEEANEMRVSEIVSELLRDKEVTSVKDTISRPTRTKTAADRIIR